MEIASLALSWLLVGQLTLDHPPPAGENPPASIEVPAAGPLVPVKLPAAELAASQLLSRELAARDSEPLPGQPISLLEVLARGGSRARQLELTQTYWRLSAAVAEYHVARDQQDRLAKLAPEGEENRLLASSVAVALAAAEAHTREAELKAARFQAELADRLGVAVGAPLPLPLEAPHVGPYRTYFAELFPGRLGPSRLRLLDQTLPIWQRAVELRAEAVQAAEDVLLAAHDQLARDETTADLVARRVADLGRERTAFLVAVLEYNLAIVDYALAVASPLSSPPALLSMLIHPRSTPRPEPAAEDQRPPAETGNSASAGQGRAPAAGSRTPRTEPSAIQPAGAEMPALDGRFTPPARGAGPLKDEAPRAPAPTASPIPTEAPPRPQSTPASSSEAGAEGDPPSRPVVEEPRRLRSLLNPQPVPLPSPEKKPPGEQAGHRQDGPINLTAARPGSGESEGEPHTANAALYAGLVSLAPNERVERLAGLLYWDRSSPEPKARPVSLAECIAHKLPHERHEVVVHYWRASEQMARHQVLCEQHSQLEALFAVLLTAREEPGGPEAMLRLRAAERRAAAERLEAEGRLRAAQFELAQRVPRWGEERLAPSTLPQAGRYEPKLDAAPVRPLEHLSRAIPALYAALQKRADAVIQADLLRAALSEASAERQQGLDELLGAVERQTDQTLGFCEALVRYNVAIAELVSGEW